MYPHQSYCNGDNTFLQVMNGGTSEYEKHFAADKTLVDVEMICQRLLEKRNDPLFRADGRNNVRIDCGYTQASYNGTMERNTILSSLMMQNKEYKDLYLAAGPLLVQMHQATVEIGFREAVKPLNDLIRIDYYARELAHKCGVDVFGWEAFSWCLNLFGSVESDMQDPSVYQNLVDRHVDSSNDHRPGYDSTGVWSCVVILGGQIYRLTLTAYTRESVGTMVEKEVAYANDSYGKVEAYLKEVGNYDQFSLKEVDRYAYELEDLSGPYFDGAATGMARCKVYVILQNAFGSKLGYYSSFADMIRQLSVRYSLSRVKQIQLLYIALLLNAQSRFWFVCSQWLRHDAFVLDREDEDQHGVDSNLVVRFFHDNRRLGWNSPVGGFQSRFTGTAGSWPGICRSELNSKDPNWGPSTSLEQEEAKKAVLFLELNLKNLELAVDRASKKEIEDESLVKSLLQSTVDGGVHHLGEFTVQAFFPIGVLSGLITQPERALYCFIAKGTAAYKWLEARGCDTARKQEQLLKGVAMKLGVQPFVVENSLCECFRANKQKDLFFWKQNLYNVMYDEETEQWGVFEKKHYSNKWQRLDKV